MNVMKCSNCGAELENGQAFCRRCGTKVEVGNSFYSSNAVPEKAPMSNKKIILIAVISVVSVLVIAGVIIAILIGTKSNQYKNNASTSSGSVLLDDEAYLLTEEEEEEVLDELINASEESKCNIVVVTLNCGQSIKQMQSFAESYYKMLDGYINDSTVMLILDVESQHIVVKDFNNSGSRDSLSQKDCLNLEVSIANDIMDENYESAFELFARNTLRVLRGEDSNNLNSASSNKNSSSGSTKTNSYSNQTSSSNNTNSTYTSNSSEYILPNSDKSLITREELQKFTKEQVRMACNELYARHGRKFQDSNIQAYFNSKSWYRGTIEPNAFNEDVFNEYEKKNKDIIVTYEKEMHYQ